jgi:hypothetical protein
MTHRTTSPISGNGGDLLTRHDVAAILRVHVRTVDRYDIPRLRLPGGHVRYRPADVEAFLAERQETKESA